MKRRKDFYLDESTIAYVEKFQDDNHISTFTAALDEIVHQHQHKNDVQASQVLVEQLAKQVMKELDSTLTRIRLAANNADRNSDIILLVLNTLMGYQQFTTFMPEDTPQVSAAKALEKERIATFRQKRLDAKNKKESEKNPDDFGEQMMLTIPEDDLL